MRKAGRFNPEKFSQLITQTFPPVKFAFGYGSAFFQQKNYQYDKVLNHLLSCLTNEIETTCF